MASRNPLPYPFKRAFWSLEPFHQDKVRMKGMFNLLAQLAGSPAKIDVGFVVTRTEPELYLSYDVSRKERFSSYPRKLLNQALKKAGLSVPLTRQHVEDIDTFSNSKAVDRALKMASSNKSNLIGLYTHSRRGYLRMAMGSFAETMIHKSPLSMLLVNPKTKFPRKIKTILFASDLSSASELHFQTTLSLCQRLRAKLVVFHAAEAVLQWSLDEANPQIHAYRRRVQEIRERIQQDAKRASVPFEVAFSVEFETTADLIVKFARRRKADLLVVGAKAGRLTALMGGSTTRNVVRASIQPVLILK